MAKSIQSFVNGLCDKTARIAIGDLVWGTNTTCYFHKANVDSCICILVETGMTGHWMAMISVEDDLGNTTATMECLDFLDGFCITEMPMYAVDEEGNIDYDTYVDLPFVEYDDVDVVVSETCIKHIAADKVAAAVAAMRKVVA